MGDFVVTSELTELRDRAQRAGLGNGVDFYIRGLPFTGQLGTELVGLSFDGHTYTVEHRGPARTIELLRTPDFAVAQDRFLREAEQCASAFTPRRPHRPDPGPAQPLPSAGPLATRLVLALVGFGCGLLVLPVLGLLVFLSTGSGSGSASGSAVGRRRGSFTRSERLSYGLGAGLGLAALLAAALLLLSR